jgi:ferredoxin-like protein FixX
MHASSMQRLVIAGKQGIKGTFKQWEEPSNQRRSIVDPHGGEVMVDFLHLELIQAQKPLDSYQVKWPENCRKNRDCHRKHGISIHILAIEPVLSKFASGNSCHSNRARGCAECCCCELHCNHPGSAKFEYIPAHDGDDEALQQPPTRQYWLLESLELLVFSS